MLPSSPFVLLHVCAATVSLLAGAMAMAFRKGSSLHALAGTIFVVSMLCMAGSGAFIALFLRPNQGNFLMGVLVIYLVSTSWVIARRRDGKTRPFDWIALLVVAAVALRQITVGVAAARSPSGSIDGYNAGMYFVFGTIALLFAASDVRMLVRGGVTGARRIARHLFRMCLALIFAMASFYPGQARLFSPEVRRTNLLYEPLVLIIGLTIFWMVRVRRANGLRVKAVS